MKIRWQPQSLPETGMPCGHGLCIERTHLTGRPHGLVAFVEGFGWLKHGEDTVVQFDPTRFPTDGPLHRELKAGVESALREGKVLGEIAPGFSIIANA